MIFLVGVFSILSLPIDKYGKISLTQIIVNANYVGASAEVVEKTVTNVLERQINGVQGMKYITSSSSNDGSSTITVTFDAGRDQDMAAVDVQNRILLAQPQLPIAVQRTGVKVSKQSHHILLAMGLYSDRQDYDNLFLSNYADLYLLDALKRIDGVSEVRIFGERRYAMRLWLDPNRLASRNLTAQDVINALNEQNIQISAGQIGQPPIPADQMYQIDITADSRLTDVAEFENIVLKTGADGSLITLRDIGRAELGAENYHSFLRFRGKEGIGMGIFPVAGSNAVEIAKAVRLEMTRLAKNFPPGMEYQVVFDTTEFVQASLLEVVKTLLQAIAVVVLVIFLFFQDWRTTLIPLITIPLSLMGTFALIKVFGFSINTFTLFGLTLAIGMVVDDAVIVVGNISRLIQEEGMSPRQAVCATMGELFGVLISSFLVLISVFILVAFFLSEIYRQFALTIAFSITISTFLALTLTPTLSALLIGTKPKPSGIFTWFLSRVNWCLNLLQSQYEQTLHFLQRMRAIAIGLLIVCLAFTGWLYITFPTALIPDEDQGYLITLIQTPEGVSLNYTSKVMTQVEGEILKLPEVTKTFAIGGFSFSGNTANSGVIFVTLKPWDERRQPGQSAKAIINKLQGVLSNIAEARTFVLNPPSIDGVGNFAGFQFQLQDKSGTTNFNTMLPLMGEIITQANQTPELQGVFSTFNANTPQMLITVDRNQAKVLQVPLDDIFKTIQIYLGSQYVNDFNFLSRTYRVYVQADAKFRSEPGDVGKLYVRSQTGKMIPLSNLVKLTPTTGAQTINHYNLLRSIEINGGAAPGFSSKQAIATMAHIAKRVLPVSMGYEWSGITTQEQAARTPAPLIFGLGFLCVFLVLAAQYENYLDPLIIMLSVPLVILGALTAQSLSGLSNDVFSQVGLVMVMGLTCKNAILMVEGANQLRQQGLSITKAAIQASQARLRPILLTALSTLLAIFPFVIAAGAGAASRQSLGTAVFGGIIGGTFLSLFVVPILYIVKNRV